MRFNKVKSTFICATISLNILGWSTLANTALAEDLTKVVETRQQNFKKMGGALKTIREELKKAPADLTEITRAATTLATLSPKIVDWFPVGTDSDSGYDSDALAKIWIEPVKFTAAANRLATASNNLLEVARQADLSALTKQLKDVKDSCSNCHKSFRAD